MNCTVEGIGKNIAMVSKSRGEREGVVLKDISFIKVHGKKDESVTTKTVTAPTKTVKVSTGGRSKKDIAIELHKKHPTAARKDIIGMLIEDAGMTKNGAATYYHNIWNAK
jgi:hypothetical protein